MTTPPSPVLLVFSVTIPPPPRPTLFPYTTPSDLYAACEIAAPFVLIAMGEQYISSSLTAILIATMPLFVALLSVRLSPGDKPTGLRLLGLVIGLGGVIALLGIDEIGRAHV